MNYSPAGKAVGYLDPISGASGDMLLGALISGGVNLELLNRALGGLELGDLRLVAKAVQRGSIACTKVDVVIGSHGAAAEAGHGGHPHRGLKEVYAILDGGRLHHQTLRGAKQVFRLLAESEGRIHGADPETVHFHEVGALDAIADIVATVEGFRLLDLAELWCGPLPVTAGMTNAAHGRIPLPAPATLDLLRDFPLRPGPSEFELVTPTGAALVRYLAKPALGWPRIIPQRTGYGAGSKDTDHPNVLRLIVGQPWDGSRGDGARYCEGAVAEQLGVDLGECFLLECNIDDMNPQLFGHVQDLLLAEGALDVYLTPVYMKKQRPGTLLSVLCDANSLSIILRLLLTETTTIGVRGHRVTRWTAHREFVEVSTPYGIIRVKLAYAGARLLNAAPEYEECRQAAQGAGVPLKTVQQAAMAAWSALSEA